MDAARVGSRKDAAGGRAPASASSILAASSSTLPSAPRSALWQRDGDVSIVAADGAALDELKDARLNDLPFVVGKGANKRLREYLNLLDAAQELRSKIEAGVFVSERRWNLKMKTGVDVKLPETDPASAMLALLKLERENPHFGKGHTVARLARAWTGVRAPLRRRGGRARAKIC